jgi:hypothetical protein
MTQTENLTTSFDGGALIKVMLIGAVVGIIPMAIFLLGVNNPDPSWGNTWIIKPLVMVPLAGATGGTFYYFMQLLRNQYNWNKILVNVLCFVVYIVGLFLGSVLGMDGTLWN